MTKQDIEGKVNILTEQMYSKLNDRIGGNVYRQSFNYGFSKLLEQVRWNIGNKLRLYFMERQNKRINH